MPRRHTKKILAYPIDPKHLDTTDEPKGFDLMLDYGERVILWTLVQFSQHKGDWDKFTWDEFMRFVDDSHIKINGPIRSGVGYFTGLGLNFLYNKRKEGEEGILTLSPSHYMIVTYFLWNPAMRLTIK